MQADQAIERIRALLNSYNSYNEKGWPAEQNLRDLLHLIEDVVVNVELPTDDVKYKHEEGN